MLKIGETVRFLNSVGGGIIKRIDEKQNLVYVEDEDGFEVPALIREVVVVGPVNETTNFPRKDFSSKPVENVPRQTEIAPEPIQVKEEIPIVETADGDTLKVLLAFFSDDIKKLQESGYECYLVNDSNYFLFYNLVIGEDGNRKSVANGMIEPNIQEWISDIRKEQLNDWENVRIQLLPLKKDKVYQEQNVLDFMLKINPVKFYKLHSFVETEYFDDPCMLFDLVEMSEKKQLTEISPEKIKEAMLEKSPSKAKTKLSFKKPAKQEIIEVDLHINSLLDTTAGMSNADMLNHQMEVFHKTLAENKKRKGQKIVFIHGKGEGVLRKEIEKELKQKYKNYYFQDASFREYGFGATMVTIK